MLGLDVYNGSQTQLTGFRNSAGISFPLLQKAGGAVSFHREDLIVVDPDGIVRFLGRVTSTSPAQGAISDLLPQMTQRPVVAPISDPVSFDSIIALGDSRTAQITVTNTGNATFEITALQADFAPFTAPLPLAVPPGESRMLHITLTPDSTGTLSGSIVFLTNADPFEVTIAPITVQPPPGPVLAVRESAVDFGAFDAARTVQQTLTIENTGTGPLAARIQSDLQGLTFSPAAFTLAPDSSAVVTLTFRNTTEGPFSGVIDILSNDPDQPTHTLSISGTVQVLSANAKADFNRDGNIDFADFLLFVGAYNSPDPRYDINGNGAVDFPDLLIFVQSFGKSLN